MNTMWTALRAMFYASTFVLLWAWVAGALRIYDRVLGGPLPQWVRWPGIAIAIGGALLALWCVVTFVTAGRGTPAPFDAPRRFVATGPYRYVRNPMYIGGMGVLAGSGLALGSPSIVAFTAGWWLVAHLFVLLYEEPHLRGRFGATYDAYCSRVRRWIPSAAGADGTPREADTASLSAHG